MGLLQALFVDYLSPYLPPLDLATVRLNLRHGRLNLSEIDLNPTPIFSFAGLPFRLSKGTIQKLALHMPWTGLLYSAPVQLEARGIQLHVEEVSFGDCFEEAFQAFEDERRRVKRRALAEGERVESTVMRLLQKILPIALDRIELEISDVFLHLKMAGEENECFCVRVSEFSTKEKGNRKRKGRGDFEKVIIARGIEVWVEASGGRAFEITEAEFEIGIGVRDGVYDIGVEGGDGVKFSVADGLYPVFRGSRERGRRWERAFRYERPKNGVCEHAREWWRYAINAVKQEIGGGMPNLSMGKFRQVVASCGEYRKLHVGRLRKGDMLGIEAEIRIVQLEDCLDADMILLLRRRARADVMAEEVSAFATTDWLRWALFGGEMSEERERLSWEIRKALAVVEQTEGEELEGMGGEGARGDGVAIVVRRWAKANLSVSLATVRIILKNRGKKPVGMVGVNDFIVRAEVDASLKSYSMSLKIREFFGMDGEQRVFRQGGTTTSAASSAGKFVEAKLLKAALDDVIALNICISPSAAMLNVARVSKYIEVFHFIRELRESLFGGEERVGMGDRSTWITSGQSQNAPERGVNFVITMDAPELSLYVWKEYSISSSKVDKIAGVVLRMERIHVVFCDALRVPRVQAAGAATLSAGIVADSQLGSLLSENQWRDANTAAHNKPALRIAVEATVEAVGLCILANVHFANANIALSMVKPLESLVSKCVLELSSIASFPGLDAGSSASLPHHSTMTKLVHSSSELELAKDDSDGLELIFNFTLLNISVQKDETESSSTVVLSAKNLEMVFKLGSISSVRAGDISLKESCYNGKVSLSPSPSLDYGVTAQFVPRNQGRADGLELTGAHMSVVAEPASVGEIVAVLLELSQLVKEATNFRVNADADHSVYSSDEAQSRISVVIQIVVLESSYEDSQVLLRFRRGHCVFHDSVLSGSLSALELVDESGRSGLHNVALQSILPSAQIPLDQRSLTFNFASNLISVHAVSLRITILRSFIECLVGMVRAFVSCIENGVIQHSWKGRDAAATPTQPSPSTQRTVCFQGSGLTIFFPRSPQGADAVSVDSSQVTMTISAGALAFCIRKLSILTKTTRSTPIYEGSTSVSSEVNNGLERDSEWSVLVRGLDLDVSHHSKDITLQSELARQFRSEWNVQVLSKVVAFISPSQVRLLKALPNSFRSSMSTSTEERSKQTLRKNGGPSYEANMDSSLLSLNKHANLKLETQLISIELVNEDDKGAVLSTIACVEVDPIRIIRQTLHEEIGTENETTVTQWTLESYQLHLEDRASEVPLRFRDVIQNGDHSRFYFPHIFVLPQQKKPALTIESVSRTYNNGQLKSSLDIKFHNLLLIPSPSLLERLVVFFCQCSSSSSSSEEEYALQFISAPPKDSKLPELSTPAAISNSDAAEKTSSEVPGQNFDPLRKISISLNNSFCQVFGRGRRVGESSIICHASLVRAVLLYGASDDLLEGSQLRVREVALSMIWLPSTTVRAEHALNSLADRLGSQGVRANMLSGRSISLRNPSPSNEQPGATWHHSLAIPGDRLRWNFFRQDNKPHDSESIAFLRSGSLRFPTHGVDRIVIVVPALSVNTHVRSLLRFAFIVSVAEVLPQLGKESQIPQLFVPEIQVAINNITVRMQTPCTPSPDTQDLDSGNQPIIRIRATLNGLIGGNLSAVSGTLKLSAYVIDQKRGIRDQLLSPCLLDFEGHANESVSLSFAGDRLIRVVMSPLTARAVTSVIFNVLPVSEARPISGVRSMDVDLHRENIHFMKSLDLSFSLRGIVLSCVAEDPRVQVLRLVLREVEFMISLPFISHGDGNFALSVQDIILEDTVSWRLYGDELSEDTGAHWSNIFAGTEEGCQSALVTKLPSPKLLLISLGALMIGDGTSEAPGSSKGNPVTAEESLIFKRNIPLCRCKMSWQSPLDHVSAHVQIRGLEFNLNMSILPSLVEWMKSVQYGAVEVWEAHLKKFAASSVSRQTHEANSEKRIGIDHLVIEPFNITISAKAPTRRIQETAMRRSLMWLFGSEEVLGLTIQTPRVVFNGDFDSPDRLFHRLRTIYIASLSSQHISKQLLWQAPRFVQLARVAITSFLRKRSTGSLFLPTGSSENSRVSRGQTASFGLLDAFADVPFGVKTHIRNIQEFSHSHADEQLLRGQTSTAENAEKSIETLDITKIVDTPVESSHDTFGKSLFRRLRRRDVRVPKDERFELYAPFSSEEALILTSHLILFVIPSTGVLRAPVMNRSHIMEYHLTGRRITFVLALPALTPVAKRAARQVRRDTSSMADHVTKDVKIAEISMHEIECHSPEYATWLHSQLPPPIAVLPSHTN